VNKKIKRSARIKDAFNYQSLEQKKMLASVGFDGPGQGSAELTYFLGEAPSSIGQAQFESTIESALRVWSDVADITFTETSQAGLRDSLDITFRQLDGAGGTLARAFFPDDVNSARIAGDVQFDRSERWEVGNEQGARAFDLLHVAVHEIGHALGLPHDSTVGSVLAPTVSPNTEFVALDQSDIDAILDLYAPAVAPPVADPDPVLPEDPVDREPPVRSPSDSIPDRLDVPGQQVPADQPGGGDQDDDRNDGPQDEPREDGSDGDNDDPDDEERTDRDRRDEFRRRFERLVNRWLQRLRQFGFRFRFR
jgi:hypothetical protein